MSLETALERARIDPERVDRVVWELLTECPERRFEACEALSGVSKGTLNLGELVEWMCTGAPVCPLQGFERAYLMAGLAWMFVVSHDEPVLSAVSHIGGWGIDFLGFPITHEGVMFVPTTTGWMFLDQVEDDYVRFEVKLPEGRLLSWTPSWTLVSLDELGELRAALERRDLTGMRFEPEHAPAFHAYLERTPLHILATGVTFERDGRSLSPTQALDDLWWRASLCGLPLTMEREELPQLLGILAPAIYGQERELSPWFSYLFKLLVCAHGLGREVTESRALVNDWAMAEISEALVRPHALEPTQRDWLGAGIALSFVSESESQERAYIMIREAFEARSQEGGNPRMFMELSGIASILENKGE